MQVLKCKEKGIEKACTKNLYWFNLHHLEFMASPHNLVGISTMSNLLQQTFLSSYTISLNLKLLFSRQLRALSQWCLSHLCTSQDLISLKLHSLELQQNQNMK